MASYHLLLWLEGPLQSWGVDSLFDRRDSLPYPSRSAISGLLCCALGAGGEQCDLLQQFNHCQLRIRGYRRLTAEDGELQSAPMLIDYQVVGNGYDARDPWQNLCVPKKSDGNKPSNTSGSKITYRSYLQDSAFAALLSGDRQLLERCATALQQPVWDLYLGRKCCVPTEMIYQGLFADADAAWQKMAALAADKSLGLAVEVDEGECEEADHQFTVADRPLAFGRWKKYRPRQVSVRNPRR